MLPVKGVDIVGPLPPELQKITVFSAGIPTNAKQPEAGMELIKYLSSAAARDAIVKSGMQPISTGMAN
jgi:molybdate transport system substrate-binding protein